MSKLVERYPQVRRLPHPDAQVDDAGLLKLLEPYLDWILAEIDTGSPDILICDSITLTTDLMTHMVLLSGRAVAVWLRNAASRDITSDIDDFFAEQS